MELALYDPESGYYARAAQRSGRAGDFFTSVDVGPLFGELLEAQIAQMWDILRQDSPSGSPVPPAFDLVEAGAGNGRLSADILRAARDQHPAFFDTIALHLVEASARARAAQAGTLGDLASRLATSKPDLPESFEGVLVANELLDALPVHQVVMRDEGLREVYVAAPSPRGSGDSVAGPLTLVEGPPSTPALQEYLDRLDVRLEPGWRVEINLRAVEWLRDAARRLRRGFFILIDYGHEARELYSATHSAGTLTSFSGHTSAGPDAVGPAWLEQPGERDITAHVDFTSVRRAAEDAGLTTIGFLDQTYFLLGLISSDANRQSSSFVPQSSSSSNPPSSSSNSPSSSSNPLSLSSNPQSAIRNPQLKTLLLPGGLGSTMKVLILGKNVGTPALRGCSFSVRAT
ncbi:MAG TPA: SAM-dependent methyltransferase [Vicinamibacterales bacterium]